MNKTKKEDIGAIPSNDTNIKLDWKCFQYSGVEVLKDLMSNNPLRSKEDIKPGDEVYVSNFGGYVKAIVSKDCAHAEDSHNIYSLRFNEDDRQCWTSDFAMNKKIIDRSGNGSK
jgi:hypothetical protein